MRPGPRDFSATFFPADHRNCMHKVNIAEKFSKITEYWKPYIGAELNGQAVKFDKLKGEFVFHHHDHEDEMFLVVKGRFRMEFRDHHEWIEEGEFIDPFMVVAELHAEAAFDDQKHFVFVVVVMKDKLAFELVELHSLAVKFGTDVRFPVFGDL